MLVFFWLGFLLEYLTVVRVDFLHVPLSNGVVYSCFTLVDNPRNGLPDEEQTITAEKIPNQG